MAFADLIVGLLVMPFNSYYELSNNAWYFGETWCDLWRSFDVFASTASIYSLVVIALDRHSAISDPINYHTRWLVRHWSFFVTGIWICSALISFPAIFYWRLIRPTNLSSNECNFTDDIYYLVFSSLISFYIPLPTMIFVYIRIYKAATRQINALRTGQKSNVKSSDGTELTLRIHRGRYQKVDLTKDDKKKSEKTALKNKEKNFSKSELNLLSPLNRRASISKSISNESLNYDKENKIMPRYKSFDSRMNCFKEQIDKQNNNKSEFLGAKFYAGKSEDEQFLELRKQSQIERDLSTISAFSSNNSNNTRHKTQYLKNKLKNFPLTKKLFKFSREQKAAKTLGIVMGVFVFCWLPFFVYNVITGIFQAKLPKSHGLIYAVFTWLGYVNSGCNPIIYAFSSRDFKRAFYKILCPSSFLRINQRLASRDSSEHTRRNIITSNSHTFKVKAHSIAISNYSLNKFEEETTVVLKSKHQSLCVPHQNYVNRISKEPNNFTFANFEKITKN